jgi:hypothetical protein
MAPCGRVLVHNATAALHETVFVSVRPGTTDPDVARYFAGQGPVPGTCGPVAGLHHVLDVS